MTLEQNFERIAGALEIIAGAVKGKDNGQALDRVQAGNAATQQSQYQTGPRQDGTAVQAVPQAQQQYRVPLQQGMVPVQTSQPVQPRQQYQAPQGVVPTQQPQYQPQQQVPTTATVQGYTLEQLQVAAAGLAGSGRMPQLTGVLQQFGIQAMTELAQERYNDFALALRGAGAQI